MAGWSARIKWDDPALRYGSRKKGTATAYEYFSFYLCLIDDEDLFVQMGIAGKNRHRVSADELKYLGG